MIILRAMCEKFITMKFQSTIHTFINYSNQHFFFFVAVTRPSGKLCVMAVVFEISNCLNYIRFVLFFF